MFSSTGWGGEHITDRDDRDCRPTRAFLTDVLGSPRVRVSFTPFVNALVSAPRRVNSSDPNEVPAVIAGATLEAGEVGIYGFAITVPRSLPPMVACSGPVRSNYILNVITSQGAEPVPVCIGQ